MPTKQGDISLLDDPIAQDLLQSNTLAHLAYNWLDGTPRVTPIWFHWNGEEIVMSSPPKAPKIKALQENPDVAITIDTNEWPYKVLLIRGKAEIDLVDGVPAEYAECAERYFGPEAGAGWVKQVDGMVDEMFRFTIRPEWVGFLDFEQRFPHAIESAMAG